MSEEEEYQDFNQFYQCCNVISSDKGEDAENKAAEYFPNYLNFTDNISNAEVSHTNIEEEKYENEQLNSEEEKKNNEGYFFGTTKDIENEENSENFKENEKCHTVIPNSPSFNFLDKNIHNYYSERNECIFNFSDDSFLIQKDSYISDLIEPPFFNESYMKSDFPKELLLPGKEKNKKKKSKKTYPYKNFPTILGKRILKWICDADSNKYNFLFKELKKRFQGVDYPEDFNLTVLNFKEWCQDLKKSKKSMNIKFYKDIWMNSDRFDDWRNKHYKFALKNMMKYFLEHEAFRYFLEKKNEKKFKSENAEHYLQLISVFLTAIENPENFNSIKE